MSTENETWRDASSAEENSGAGRDGNQFNKEGGYSRPSYNRDNGDRPYRPRFNSETGTARSVLITVTALIARALILVRTMVTVRSVLVTITIMATVPIVRAITAKMATVRSVLATIMRVVTVLIVHASIRVVEDLADTATETAIAVQSVVRPIMTPMLSTARRNR